ncbi:polysaccharide deacetylase family protein [Bacillus cereus group sp. N6]|uniref:polysaccharide deacetylase family protein n=1 Tax=Bacillus cereus group sp. N6 TaxID=2794583 RepID=UPI001F5B10D3|nr:polysaccharide deacetylase family protein [Bacillus cereus group sp. N6]
MVSLICILCFLSIPNNGEARVLSRRYLEPTGIVTWDVSTNKKVIAITFDDGPHAIYTQQILEVLDKYNAKATFFMLGFRIQRYPQLVQAVLSRGHEIGNHTMKHVYANDATSQQIQADILEGQKYIEKYKKNSLLFRPPGGYVNDAVFTIAKQKRYQIVLWSWHQDPHDWSKPGVNAIANHVIKNARGGDIVLLHDGGGNRQQTVEALKIILPALQKQGYQFVKVSDLLQYKY